MNKIEILRDLVSDAADLAADEFMSTNAGRLDSLGFGSYPANYKTASSNAAKLNMFKSLALRLRTDLDVLLADERKKNAPVFVAPKPVPKAGPVVTAETRFIKAAEVVVTPGKRGRKPKQKLAEFAEEAAKVNASFRIPTAAVQIAPYVPIPAHKRFDARIAFFRDARRAPCTQTGLSEEVLGKLSADAARRLVAVPKDHTDGSHPYDPRNVIFRHRNLLASNPVTRRVLEAYEVHQVIGAPVALDMMLRAINEEHQHAMGRKPKRAISEHNPRLVFDHRPCKRKPLPGLPNQEDRTRRAVEGMRLAAIEAGEIATFNPKRSGGTFENRWSAIQFDRPEPEREDVVTYATKGSKADEKANKLLGAVKEPKVKMRQIPRGI